MRTLSVRRVAASLLLILALAPGTWLRTAPLPANHAMALRFVDQSLLDKAEIARNLGAFRLERAWRMESPNAAFGSYSALLPLGGGRLLAIADRSGLIEFTPPPSPRLARLEKLVARLPAGKWTFDAEGAAFDPASRTVWISWETTNMITRHDLGFHATQAVWPRAMADWGINSGPEAMVRLADGRFVVLREGFSDWFGRRRHRALLFAGDPITAGPPRRFTFVGPPGFSPTDMAPLPDGRVLILMRRLVWPLPARFAGLIAIADPRGIGAAGGWRADVIARLGPSRDVDNFEGMAIEPSADGTVTVWLISDDNNAAFQRTLLWRLAVDPARLPWPRQRARERAASPAPKVDLTPSPGSDLRPPASSPVRASP